MERPSWSRVSGGSNLGKMEASVVGKRHHHDLFAAPCACFCELSVGARASRLGGHKGSQVRANDGNKERRHLLRGRLRKASEL